MNGELEELGERIAEQAAHLDAAMHRLLTDLREFDARGGWRVQGAASCAHWLAWRVGWDPVTARDHVRVARKLAGFGQIDDALRRGELSYSKVRALLRVATPANEALLLDHARLMTASQLEKLCRKYALVQRHGQDDHPPVDEQRRHVRRRDLEDGMVKIEAVLHPEEAELVWTMLDHTASRLARQAAAAAATGEMAGQDSAESREAACDGSAEVESLEAASAGSADAEARHAEPAGSAGAEHGPGWPDVASSPQAVSQGEELQAPACLEGRGVDDSAESPAGAERRCAADSAACGELPGRSLLDRLLDEAVALCSIDATVADGADAARWDRLEATSGQAGAARATQQLNQQDASMLRDRAAAARHAFNRADALVELAQGYLRGDRPDRPPIEVTVTVPASMLRDELADPVEVGEMGESFVSREAARRLSCDAGVVEIVEDEQGTPLSVGRKRRTIAGALRRALYRRDRSCTFPGCTNRMFLEGHHIRHWADGGETSLSNAILLCGLHHRCVHELGYTIELGPDQRPRFRDPQGRIVAVVPEAAAPADLGWPRIRAANEPLGIDAGTIAGPWDGTPVDYSRIVGHLLAADGLA